MTEPFSDQTYVARLSAPRAQAERIAHLLSEAFDPDVAACAAFEAADGSWQVEAHFAAPPDESVLRDLVETAAGGDANAKALAAALTLDTIEPRDWVKESLEGLKPVAAGRFIVHGAHDRDAVPPSAFGIEIEAALAFGTGHHGTTRGCLLMLDRIARQARPRRILDLGTGTGVLAIAAAKRFRVPVLASDIDRASVRIAQENAALNRIAPMVRAIHASGLSAPRLAASAPYDLAFANILLPPLRRLAVPLSRALAPNGHVILSGLLLSHANAALAAYRAQGLVLIHTLKLDGWATLLLRKPPR